MSFDRTRLPDPLTYYEGQGVAFRERKGKWRTTACLSCASSNAMRINTDSGAFVCMTGCGARGGDVLAWHMAAHGMDFITAAQELGAWIEDGKPAPRKASPISPRQALQVLAGESNLAAIAAANAARGVVLTDIDLARCLTAARRIARIAEVFA